MVEEKRIINNYHTSIKNKVILKGDTGNLNISIIRRNNIESDNYWDANWILANIEIIVPGFRGNYETNLRIDDLQRFYVNLIDLQKLKKNTVEFTTLEEGLYLNFTASKRGTVKCIGTAKNNDNSLNFTIETDLPSIKKFETGLKYILDKYPLIGKFEQ